MAGDNFDKFLSQTFKAGEIQADVPMNQVEQQIIERYKTIRNQKKKKQRLILQAAVVMIALLAICGSIISPPSAYAFRDRIIHTIQSWGRCIHIQISNSSNSSPQLISKIESDVAALQPKIPFTILTPRYVPPGFILENVEKNPQDEQPVVIFTFKSKSSSIMLVETEITGNYQYTTNIDAKQGRAEKTKIGKYECDQITFNDGTCTLIWVNENNIQCQLFGDLSPEQAREMAISMP